MTNTLSIKDIRQLTGLSQSKFADRYKIPLRTLQDWECGRREPAVYFVLLLERCVRQDFMI